MLHYKDGYTYCLFPVNVAATFYVAAVVDDIETETLMVDDVKSLFRAWRLLLSYLDEVFLARSTKRRVTMSEKEFHMWVNVDRGVQSSEDFRAYLSQFQLTIFDLASASQVRLSTLWNITHGIPVRKKHALAVRLGLEKLTGVPYFADIVVIPDEIVDVIDKPKALKPTRLSNLNTL